MSPSTGQAIILNPRTQALWFCVWTAVLSLYGVSWAETNLLPEFTVTNARNYLEAVATTLQTQASASADSCFLRARLSSQLGKKDEAVHLTRQALEYDPNRADLHAFLGDLFIRQDRMQDALESLRKALEMNPKLPGGYRRLGMVLDRLGDRASARQAFESGIRQDPTDATDRLLLGRLLLDQDQVKEAAVLLEKACQLDPDLASAFYALSQAQNRLGNQEAARRTLQTFQQLKQKEKAALDGDNLNYSNEKVMRTIAAEFHTETAILFLQQQQPVVAEAHLRQAMRIDAQYVRAREVLGQLLLRARQLPEARQLCEQLVRLRPSHAAYRANLGTLCLQLKDFPAAVAELKRALELDPNQPDVLNNLVRYYLGTKTQLPEALRLSRHLTAIEPTAANFDLLGWACYANGQMDEARAASAQAVQRDSTNAVYRERYRRLQQVP